jgi:hypothetical protein
MAIEVVMMRIATVKDFRDNTTKMFRSTEPVLITRKGKVAGFFIPFEGEMLPLELKKELQLAIAEMIKKNLQAEGLSEEDILEDFEKTRNSRRRR